MDQRVVDRIVLRQFGGLARHATPLRIVGAAAQYARTFAQRAHLQARVLQIADPDRDVVAAMRQGHGSVVAIHGDFKIGVLARERGNDRSQVQDAERHRRGDTQSAAQRHRFPMRGHAFGGLVNHVEQWRDALVEGFPGLGGLKLSGRAMEELYRKGDLQVADAFADHGLRHVEPPRR